MGKSSGGTRSSSSGSPRGLNIVSPARLNSPEAIRQDIADTQDTIGELRTMQDDIYSRISEARAYLEVEPENEEYYQNRIDELYDESNAIDGEINNLRAYIEDLQKRLNR